MKQKCTFALRRQNNGNLLQKLEDPFQTGKGRHLLERTHKSQEPR